MLTSTCWWVNNQVNGIYIPPLAKTFIRMEAFKILAQTKKTSSCFCCDFLVIFTPKLVYKFIQSCNSVCCISSVSTPVVDCRLYPVQFSIFQNITYSSLNWRPPAEMQYRFSIWWSHGCRIIVYYHHLPMCVEYILRIFINIRCGLFQIYPMRLLMSSDCQWFFFQHFSDMTIMHLYVKYSFGLTHLAFANMV